MEPAERLAAYLADELATDERRALERDLARDPALRSDLEAMRRADDALGTEEATVLPDGARDRLHAALDPVLATELDGSAVAAPVTDAGDELAARRRPRTSRRTWLAAAGGVAAAALAVAVVVPSLTTSGADRDEATEDSMAAITSDDGGAGEEAADGGGIPSGPIVIGGDRELDAAGADALLAAPELQGLATYGLAPEEAVGLASGWAAELGADAGAQALARTNDASAGAESADEPATEEAETEAEAGDATTQAPTDDQAGGSDTVFADPSVDDAARADVGRCLDVLLATGDLAVPVTAELVVFDGEPSIAYGLVGRDADGQVTRREVWVLARESCEVRYFSQA